jgi:large subunit ribosomal protein L10
VLDGKPLSPDEIKKLADLESREVLLAKLAGAMNASLQNAVSLFAAPLAQAARVIDALRAKAELDPSILRGGAGVPLAAEAPAEAPAEAVAEAPAEAVAEAPAEAVADAPAEAPAAPAEPPNEAAAETPVAPAEAVAEAPAEVSTDTPTEA